MYIFCDVMKEKEEIEKKISRQKHLPKGHTKKILHSNIFSSSILEFKNTKKNLTLNSFLSGVKYFCKFLLHHARYYDCVSACFSRILRLEFVFFAYYIQFFVFLWLVKRVFDDHRRVWDYFISDPTNKFSLYVIASECHFAYK